MFKIFSFELGDIFNANNIGKISGIVQSFLDAIDIDEFTKDSESTFNDDYCEENAEGETVSFIELNQDEDMYLLTIDLKGIDLRELSIRYDPGIIEVNLNRSEMQRNGLGIFLNTIIVKKAYNKKFENIEEIETSQLLKSIDNGILSIRMPKKYTLGQVIDVDSYEDNF